MNELIVNDDSSNFYNYITKLLNECNFFVFNVAFVNFSGVQLLLDSFEELNKKGIKGKILTSTYLNFTEPIALERLKEFNNIDLRVYDSTIMQIGFHSKAYIFEFNDKYEVIVGSANLTSSAFKSNIEWNCKTITKKDDTYIKDIFLQFDKLWEQSHDLNEDFLEKYKEFYNLNKNKNEFTFEKDIKANKMQSEALKKLEYLREKGESKALAIASTGSGKTYLSVFDVKKYNPNRLLFIVHRENILIKAKQSFESIIKNKTMGLYTGNKKELEKDFIFSTVQTLSQSLENFDENSFDYIVVDEAHHISSNSYKKIIGYFKAKFLLGLTATPNRMDGENIYEYFDENVACDIRLNEALEHKLITPFHYYGVTDICVDYTNTELNKIEDLSKLLMLNKRVDFIIEKMNFYGFSGKKRKVLGFCVSKEHCNYMEKSFNKRGIKSISLTSDDSILKREKNIKLLEDDKEDLEVIFCVDIFNEGVDIPSINTILMLRPTNSAIVFAQQLGRGLRKYKNKEFLTLIDFIGNHQRAFLIALAMVGKKKIDKESIKLSLLNDFASFKNAFINIDKISKRRILEQINKENFNSMKYLKDEYFKFKEQMLNKIPILCDYINFDEFVDPLKFVSESKSYVEFISKVEREHSLNLLCENENFLKTCRFIEYLLPIKRVHEFVILRVLLKSEKVSLSHLEIELEKYQKKIDKNTLIHAINFLKQDYFDKAQISRYPKLIEFEDDYISSSEIFKDLLKDKNKRVFIEQGISYGIINYEKTFALEYYGLPALKLYEKYNMLNIAQLCNFNKIHSSFRGSGFLKFEDDFFLFITIDKEKYKKAQKYVNDFISKEVFSYSSKPSHSSIKGDGLRLCQNEKFNVKLHIFVRKYAKVDKKTQSFIYLGLANTISYENEKPIDLKLKLEKPLPTKLYEEFTILVD
ncbi:DEAD/DEAH box helicase [Arcobacter roscoffensis]|uniref:DEAD/DEAH box helicase n=1 Tax=Arcobacter roscoffensis TaxID=2961520 RepID=A0ABY5E7P9_9BACT|nr:DEAD/DEAH box helicase [Arcobacter roscoffensis]UTJ06770.1 DEAD/DEAH box helicase [Arcobacter roscoffensis]